MEFQCKEFSLNHSKSSMKIGTDAILLSSLTPTINPKNILDIGTGCGIIALCMAQKYSLSQVTAIDIDYNSILEACLNFENSKYSSRLIAKQIDLLSFSKETSDKFDLIVSNPPFFISSLKGPSLSRNQARHTSALTYENIIHSASKLLSKKGVLCIILPKKESEIFIEIANVNSLIIIKKINIYSKSNKECERVVLHIILQQSIEKIIQDKSSKIEASIITLRNFDNTPTKEYLNLIKDFLL